MPAGTVLARIDSLEASESLFLGSESFAFESCSANSFANSALVSSTVGMRVLWYFLLFLDIVRNNRNESFWNFVLIQKELDKGPFVVCVLRSSLKTRLKERLQLTDPIH